MTSSKLTNKQVPILSVKQELKKLCLSKLGTYL